MAEADEAEQRRRDEGRTRPAHARSAATAPKGAEGLRVALFSGNYNMVRDGANKALNRLMAYLLSKGAAVRVYSPTIPDPAFEPVGDLVSVPSFAIPTRKEYRFSTHLPARVKEDIRAFAPNVFHLSAPDVLGRRAQSFARELGVPVVASLHTLFQTYLRYYGLGFLEGPAERFLNRYYSRCDWVLAPNEALAQDLRTNAALDDHVRIWSRGVDHELWSREKRSLEWRRQMGFADDEAVPLFFGRLVKEKGLDVFQATIAELRARGRKVRPLVVGAGPAGEQLAAALGEAVFTGHVEDDDLARAVASADILLNPSTTEAFGNVNLEAMACGLPIIGADCSAARGLIAEGRSGLIVPPEDIGAWADAVEALVDDPARRLAMGQAAMEASKAFRWSVILDRVIDTYCIAVANGPRSHDPSATVSSRRQAAAAC